MSGLPERHTDLVRKQYDRLALAKNAVPATHIDTSQMPPRAPVQASTRLGQHGNAKKTLGVGRGCRGNRAAIPARATRPMEGSGSVGSRCSPHKLRTVESRNRERDKLQAERDKLKATDVEGLSDAWAMIEGIWSGTIARVGRLPEPVLHEQVEGEWSFVQTHRHLVLATDCWLRRMVKAMAHPYHPWGLAGGGSPVLAGGASTRTPTRPSTRCSACAGSAWTRHGR